jgi:hypothetical protein
LIVLGGGKDRQGSGLGFAGCDAGMVPCARQRTTIGCSPTPTPTPLPRDGVCVIGGKDRQGSGLGSARRAGLFASGGTSTFRCSRLVPVGESFDWRRTARGQVSLPRGEEGLFARGGTSMFRCSRLLPVGEA